MKLKEESENVGLKLNIQKTKTIAFIPITSWQIDGETMETVTDWLHQKIKRHLLLGRKAMTNLESMLKSRNITLPTKIRLVKSMVFLVVMNGCQSWTKKKTDHRRIDALNCDIGEDSWESFGLQGHPTSSS